MSLNLIQLGSNLVRRDHLVVDMARFGAFWREEFVIVVEVFDFWALARSEGLREGGNGMGKGNTIVIRISVE